MASSREAKRLDPVQECVDRYHKFENLDEVWAKFLQTNRHQGNTYSFDQLLSLSGPKRYFKYEHSTQPYLATVTFVEGADGPWLNIKLVNAGFVYKRKQGDVIARHKSRDWIKLHSCLHSFKKLKENVSPFYSTGRAYYNFRESRLVLKFTGPTEEGYPNLMISFRPGFHNQDEDDKESFSLGSA